jgi:hypothetical protein
MKGKVRKKRKVVKYPLPKEGLIAAKPRWEKSYGKLYPMQLEE